MGVTFCSASLSLARSASLLHDPPLPPIVHLDSVAVSCSSSPSNLAQDLLTTNMPARNADQEKEILQWIEAVMGEPVPSGDFAEVLENGVGDEEIFQTPDLFEARNIPQVTLCLYALGRTTQKHPEYTGPQIGPKMSTENKRNFTEEQIKKGRDGQIGLQAGSNKGASQAGHG